MVHVSECLPITLAHAWSAKATGFSERTKPESFPLLVKSGKAIIARPRGEQGGASEGQHIMDGSLAEPWTNTKPSAWTEGWKLRRTRRYGAMPSMTNGSFPRTSQLATDPTSGSLMQSFNESAPRSGEGRNAWHSNRIDGDRICRSGEQKGRRGKAFAHQPINVFVETKLNQS